MYSNFYFIQIVQAIHNTTADILNRNEIFY